MTEPTEDEFSEVNWDVPSVDPLSASKSHFSEPAVLDPLSDVNDAMIQTLDLSRDDPNDSFHTIDHTHERSQSSGNVEQTNPDPLTQSSIDAAVSSPLHDSMMDMTSTPFTMQPGPVPSTSTSRSYPSTSSISSPSSFEPKPVSVTDPRKESDGQQPFVSYNIVSKNATVRRRFQDFVWLYNVLYNNYPACIIPPLPDKHRLEYVKGDRFSTDFVEKRRDSLGRFLQRIARHPILSHSEYFVMFLESSEFNDSSARALRDSQETVIESLGDSLLNAFTKIRKPDQVFLDMKDRVDRMEENFSLLEKTLSRTNKRVDDLSHDYVELANSVNGLGQLETNFQQGLALFSNASNTYANQVKTLAAHETDWLHHIHDYMAYHLSMKEVLKLRDQKQLDFEELSEYLQSTVKDRDRTMHGVEAQNLTGFLAGKLNEVRGADMSKIRRERVLRLDDRIHELEDAIEQSNEVSSAFSDQVKKENEYFTRNNALEMHEALKAYASAKVSFYQQGIDTWQHVVDALEEQS